jgi:hypothetical protein
MGRFKKILSKAEEVRRAARKSQGAMADFAAPGIKDADDVLVDTDNTVLASVLKDPAKKLVLVVPQWNDLAPPGVTDTLTVYHFSGSSTTPEVLFTGEYSQENLQQPGDPVVEKELDKTAEVYGDGNHYFECKVEGYMGGEVTSGRLSLRFDRVAPNQGNVPPAVPAIAPVTDANVAAVSLTLPDYPDRAPGDKVHYYWLKEMPDDFNQVTPVGSADVTGPSQALAVPRAAIEAAGDGEFFAFYVLVDKAGNVGQLSLPQLVSVALGAMPANLKEPVVPLAADGLIDREDAVLGVQVHIPVFDNWKASDEVSVTWAGTLLDRRAIGAGQTFPLVVSVLPQVLRDAYGLPATGTKDMTVSYEVWRGGRSVGTKSTEVQVNFETFGPVDPGSDPDPDWPEIINDLLPLCDVYGEGSTTANVLLPEHDGKPAKLEVKLYENLAVGDLIEFFWDGEHVVSADYTVIAADKAGDTLERTIAWEYIQRGDNGQKAVDYRLTRTLVPNSPRSKPRIVDVTAVVLHPDEPVFEGVNPKGWLSCESLVDPANPSAEPAVRITVGDLSKYGLVAGASVTMKWWVLHGLVGSEEVDDAAFEETVTLGTDYPVSGFTWRVEPYVDYIFPIYEYDALNHTGRARCTYEFEDPALLKRGIHKVVVSNMAEQRIAMHDPNGPCEVFY